MNENSSNVSTSTSHHGLTADAIARRAYEIWEQEGRPENRDLHHWLRAEQELVAQQSSSGQSSGSTARTENSDAQMRGGAKPSSQPARKPSGNPFPAETAGGRFVQSPPPSTSSRSRSGGK